MKVGLVLALALLGGCEDLPLARVTDGGVKVPPPSDMSCPTAGPPVVTWSYLYANYFGPNTPGHCGNSECHQFPGKLGHGNWVCGTSSDSCYQGMVSRSPPLLNQLNPPASRIANPGASPLVWFNPDTGNMPFDNNVDPNFCAVRDIVNWLHSDGGASEN